MSEEVGTIDENGPQGGESIADLLAAAIARSTATSVNMAELLASADVVEGKTQVDLLSLCKTDTQRGMPHVITGVTFHKSDVADAEIGDYVSCEFVAVTDPPIEGFYNVGGKGVRRALVQYLALKGLIAREYADTPDSAVWSDGETAPFFSIRFLAPRGLVQSRNPDRPGDSPTTFFA